MSEVKVGIIGSGNIGSDLMVKLRKSEVLELTTMMGIDPTSRGMQHAKHIGLTVFDNGIDGLLEQPDLVDILLMQQVQKHIFIMQKLLKTRETDNRLDPGSNRTICCPNS